MDSTTAFDQSVSAEGLRPAFARRRLRDGFRAVGAGLVPARRHSLALRKRITKHGGQGQALPLQTSIGVEAASDCADSIAASKAADSSRRLRRFNASLTYLPSS